MFAKAVNQGKETASNFYSYLPYKVSRIEMCFWSKMFLLLSFKTQLTGNKPLSRIKTKKKANISNQRKLRRQRQCRHKTIISPIYNSLPHATRRCFRCGCLRQTLLKLRNALPEDAFQSIKFFIPVSGHLPSKDKHYPTHQILPVKIKLLAFQLRNLVLELFDFS